MRFEGANHSSCDVEATISIGRVFGVPQDSLFEIVGEEDGALGWDAHQEFELGAAFAVESGTIVDLLDECR